MLGAIGYDGTDGGSGPWCAQLSLGNPREQSRRSRRRSGSARNESRGDALSTRPVLADLVEAYGVPTGLTMRVGP